MPFPLLEKWRRAAIDLALPPRCGACDLQLDEGAGGALICPECLGQLELIDWPVCRRCAAMIPVVGGSPDGCHHCTHDRLRFEHAWAVVGYEGHARRLVQRMKSELSGQLARMFVELAWDRFGAELADARFDAVASIPPHQRFTWRAVADAPRMLAETLARRLRIPYATRLLALDRRTVRQVGLSRAGRFANIKGKMRVAAGHRMTSARILLVDDILTTGATCSEAARVLVLGGAAEVDVFVVGRTPADELPRAIL